MNQEQTECSNAITGDHGYVGNPSQGPGVAFNDEECHEINAEGSVLPDTCNEVSNLSVDHQAEETIDESDASVQPSVDEDLTAASLASILEFLTSMDARLGECAQMLADKRGLEQAHIHQAETLKAMSQLIRELEDDLFQEILNPILNELIALHDSLVTGKKAIPVNLRNNEKHNDVRTLLQSLDDQILNTLSSYDISLMRDTSKILDPSKQRVVKTQYLKQPKDNEVAAVIRHGFYKGGKVFRPEEVSLTKHKQGE